MARNIPKLIDDDADDITTYSDELYEDREELIPNRKANGKKDLVHTPHFNAWEYVVGDLDEDPDGFEAGINIEDRKVHDMDGWDDDKDCNIGDIGHREGKINKAGRQGYRLPSRIMRELEIEIEGDFDE